MLSLSCHPAVGQQSWIGAPLTWHHDYQFVLPLDVDRQAEALIEAIFPSYVWLAGFSSISNLYPYNASLWMESVCCQ